MMKQAQLLLLVAAALAGACSGSKGAAGNLEGKWNATADNIHQIWHLYADGRFEYSHSQESITAKVQGIYRVNGDTLQFTPQAARADGAHFEASMLQSQLMIPFTLKIRWDGPEAFDAVLGGTEHTLHFRR
jgi:hypothetical protein